MPPIVEHTEEIDGVPIFWREAEAEAEGGAAPTLYVHGVPDSSDAWVPFLERGGGLAVDLPGFGRSAKRADLDFTIPGYDRFLERFLAHVGVGRLRLVVHDWGAVGLAFAQRFPERIERLVVVDAVPLLPGYRWHRFARLWRTRGVGELAMGATTKSGLRLAFREGIFDTPRRAEHADQAWAHFDAGTQRAILRLYRSSPPEVLARAGARLGSIAAPALVLHGERDPYIPARFAADYARALGAGEHELVPGAGHWPWLERPALVDRIVGFATA